MNPFELQAEFARQWFALVGVMAPTMMTACTSMGREQASSWTGDSAPRATPSPTPFSPFPWEMSPATMDLSAFAVPFAPTTSLFHPALAFAPWAPLFTGGFPLPLSPGLFPFATSMWHPLAATWAFPPNAFNPWASFFTPRNPGAELVEQVASNYRSASGYAVAAIVGPFGAALGPRKFGEPWWQSVPAPNRLN